MPSEEEQKRFLDLCEDGDLETIEEMIAKNPLLIKSKDSEGKLNYKIILKT